MKTLMNDFFFNHKWDNLDKFDFSIYSLLKKLFNNKLFPLNNFKLIKIIYKMTYYMNILNC